MSNEKNTRQDNSGKQNVPKPNGDSAPIRPQQPPDETRFAQDSKPQTPPKR